MKKRIVKGLQDKSAYNRGVFRKEGEERGCDNIFLITGVCSPNKWMPILVAKPHIMQQQKG